LSVINDWTRLDKNKKLQDDNVHNHCGRRKYLLIWVCSTYIARTFTG